MRIKRFVWIILLPLSGCFSRPSTIMNEYLFDEARTIKLIHKGVNPNKMLSDGQPLLHKAITFQRVNVALELIAHGADVNERDVFQDTPLHYAADFNNVWIAAALIDKGADVNARGQYGATPLLRVGRRHAKNALAMGKLLIEKGAELRAVDRYGTTALHQAALIKDPQLAEYLISKGLHVDAREAFRDATPLLLCAMDRLADRDPRTPLAAAALIEHGADINAEDNEGYTPLTRALWAGNDGLARFFKNLGAKAGKVPELRAVEEGMLIDPRVGGADPIPPGRRCPRDFKACLQTCCPFGFQCCLVRPTPGLKDAGYCAPQEDGCPWGLGKQ